MTGTSDNIKQNSTGFLEYDFTFYRSIKYNINNLINIITIDLNVIENNEQRTFYYLNKKLKKRGF